MPKQNNASIQPSKEDHRATDDGRTSSVVAIIGMVAVGLIAIPPIFVLGGGMAMSGALILAALILLQSTVFGIAKLLTGGRKGK